MKQFGKSPPAVFRGPAEFAKFLLAVWIVAALLTWQARADSGCAICGAPFGAEVYFLTDKVTETKKQVCYNCTMFSPRCFACGLPVHGNFTKIEDGRVMCERDAKNAVLEQEEANRIFHETKENLDRLLSRFLTLPDNVTLELVDRPRLERLFVVIGHDNTCPNVLGCMHTSTNHGNLEHQMWVLSGLPRDGFKATCAHEFSHAWLDENLPQARKQTLRQDAIEGFCELVSFTLMELQEEEAEKKTILANNYTRGQVQLLIDAKTRYGLQEVIDWIKSGTDPLLDAADLGRVRSLEARPTAAAPVWPATVLVSAPPPAEEPGTLVLRGLFWGNKRPVALVNDRSFEVNEEGKVRIGKTNTLVRCLEIRQDSVRVRILPSGEEQELRLKNSER